MSTKLRKRLVLLGTTSLFTAALVAAPVQFSTVTPDLAVAHAFEDANQDNDTDQANPDNPGQPTNQPEDGD